LIESKRRYYEPSLSKAKLPKIAVTPKKRNYASNRILGSKHGQSRFIESEVIEIRKIMKVLMEQGLSVWEAAYKLTKSYGCAKGTLVAIARRETWTHI